MEQSIYINKFDCGCVFDFRSLDGFTTVCDEHKSRPEDCRCLNAGEDDGAQTCFQHHDCSRGECTHQDGDDYPEGDDDEE